MRRRVEASGSEWKRVEAEASGGGARQDAQQQPARGERDGASAKGRRARQGRARGRNRVSIRPSVWVGTGGCVGLWVVLLSNRWP